MPILNRYRPLGTTAEVESPTTKPCIPTTHSHINQVVGDALRGLVKFYAKNDHVGLTIQYDYFGVLHNYEPDFLVRLMNGVTLLLEIKGQEDNRDQAKHDAADRRIAAVISASCSADASPLSRCGLG